MRRKLALIAGLVLVVGAISAGIATAAGGGGRDDDQELTGSPLEQATQAALAHTGGGTVTETETGDDGAVYGVEIRLGDGSQVEVSLDSDFNVIGQDADDDGSGGEDQANDD
jgi:peptidase YpeB-like protein